MLEKKNRVARSRTQPTGCNCFPGQTGANCDLSGAASVYASLGLVLASMLAALFFAF